MSEVQATNNAIDDIHAVTLGHSVNERILNVLGMNPHYIEILKHNNIIPCTVKQFVTLEGSWVKEIVEAVKLLLWNENGEPLCAHAQFGNEFFHYDDESGHTFVGFTNLGEQSVHSTYRMSDGRVIRQAIVETETGKVLNVLNECKYKDDLLKEIITPVMVPASDQQSYVDTGNVNIERFLFKDGFCVEEVHASVQRDKKGRIPALTRDMFSTKIYHEYEDGKCVRSKLPDVFGKMSIVNFEWDAQGNLVKQSQDGALVALITNAYDSEGRLLSMTRHEQAGVTMTNTNGRYERSTEDKDVVLIDLAKYY